MAWVPPAFLRDLKGVSRSNYVFIKCIVCGSCYRWGIYGFREGLIHCPICGAITTKPKLIDKVEYIQYLQRIRTPRALEELQQMLWSPQDADKLT